MKFATVRPGGHLTGAVVNGDIVLTVNADNATDAYFHWNFLQYTGELDAATAHFARVSPTPAHVLCIGLNYRSHIHPIGTTARHSGRGEQWPRPADDLCPERDCMAGRLDG
jgi:acylpyruvate hydrolase